MDEDARLDYIGRKLIQRQGCFGCHPGMPGFEEAQPIGTELTTWASKLITKLDFGLTDIPHTKVAFLRNKLTDPRIYDSGKVATKHPQDLLRMPDFGFSDEQVSQLTTALLSFSRDLVQLEGHRRLSFRDDAIEQGRRVVQEFNCQGCHVIESSGGGMETVLEGAKPFSPPVLASTFETPDGRIAATRQGSKTQPDWFFSFLKQPSTIRPWLNVRMPTFGLSDGDATALVRYFAALADEPFPYTYLDAEELDPTVVAEGKKLFQQFQCINCHLPLEEATKLGVAVADLAPNLELAKERLQYAWLKKWLTEPGAIQEGTRMPAFFYLWDEDENEYMKLRPDAEHEIEALRSYLQFHGGALPSTKLARR